MVSAGSGTQQYWPYGGYRGGGIGTTDLRFTGQREEISDAAGLGLYNYNARFYSTTLGRFISGDPVSLDGINRYTYVRDNPLRYADPSGLCAGIWQDTGCDEDTQLAILDRGIAGKCSDAAPHDDMVSLSKWFIAQDSFWLHVDNTFTHLEYGEATYYQTHLLTTIMGLDESGFANVSPNVFGFLAMSFGVQSAFMRASLADLMFGTDAISDLPIGDIEGAWPWWEGLPGGWVVQLRAIDRDRYGLQVTTRFVALTVAYATLESLRGSIKDVAWSYYQQTLLFNAQFQVDRPDLLAARLLPGVIRSYYQLFSFNAQQFALQNLASYRVSGPDGP